MLILKVIYRDFKPFNVLLDEYFKPKLSDCGLAKKGPTDDYDHVSTEVSRLCTNETIENVMHLYLA